MSRTSLAIAVGLAFFGLRGFGASPTANQRMAETIANADKLFGRHYTVVPGKPLRLYYKQTETVPPSEIIYSHGSGYVLELIFAADGTIAALL